MAASTQSCQLDAKNADLYTMKSVDSRHLAQRFRRQYSVMGRSELRALGVTARMEAARVARGEWDRPVPHVVRLAGSRNSPEQDLMLALLECSTYAIASHRSAAWLWGLAEVPDPHEVTIPFGAGWRRGCFAVHRLKDMPVDISFRRDIPCTNPLRTLVDLAGVCAAAELDDALDRALAVRLVTLEGIRAEMQRLGRPGRKGVGAMRAALRRRGLVAAPNPSVLESRTLRLLRSGGITVQSVEVVVGPHGEYRADVELDPRVLLEVDGHVFHSMPEQKAYDEQRRAEIRLGGKFVLVCTWRDIVKDGRRVLKECHRALALYGSAAGRLAVP